MPNITVLTPTIRPGSLELARNSLKNQSFTDFEWLIGSPFDPEIPEAKWVKDDFTGGYWSMNRITNKMLAQAQGELIVSLQDWIWIQPDGLEKFWLNYQATGKDAVISGVGDQYSKLDEYGKPTGKIWDDPRKTDQYGTFYECTWPDIEFNYAAVPRKVFDTVGLCDEQLDFIGIGIDLYQVMDRYNDAGGRFFLDQTNESFTLRHNRDASGGEEKWNKAHSIFTGAYLLRKEQLIAGKSWPKLVDEV